MKKLLIILTFLIKSQFSFCQTGTIEGCVHNGYENEALGFSKIVMVSLRKILF